MASLVYHSGALGDFITTLPAFELWKRMHPGERMVLLGRPAHGALAGHLFDETWDAAASRWAPLFSTAESVSVIASGLLRGVSSALLYTSATSPVWAAVSQLDLGEVLRQDPFPPRDPAPAKEVHIVDYHLEPFAGRFREADRVPRLPAAGSASGRHGVALHHGSGSPTKNWPYELFTQLPYHLADRGLDPAWITGPAENEAAAPRSTEEWRSLPLRELADRLAARRLYVGNDSGVTHLAAAVGCPTVVLFGATNPRVWAPRGPRVRVVRAHSAQISDVELEGVLAAGLDLLGGQ